MKMRLFLATFVEGLGGSFLERRVRGGALLIREIATDQIGNCLSYGEKNFWAQVARPNSSRRHYRLHLPAALTNPKQTRTY